jgi:antitoxin ParD1/3/4
MGTLSISLPDGTKAWVEEQVRLGAYESASAYVNELIERDREEASEMTLDELRRKLATSKASGPSKRSLDEIFAEAVSAAQARGHK